MNLAAQLAPARTRRFGLWASVRKLLWLRLRIWWNTFRRAKRSSRIGTIVLAVLALAGMGLLFFLSSRLLRFAQSPELAELIDPARFLALIPGLVLTMVFIMTLLTSFGVLLQALYLSHDMDFLVAAPLPMRAVFLAKMLEAILPNFAWASAFSLPLLFGLGSARGYTIFYYPLLVLTLASLALAAGGLAAILVMAVARIFPPRRVAEVLGFLVATSSILCGQSANIMNAVNRDGSDMSDALAQLGRVDMPWSPLSWAGRGLDALGQGDWLAGLGLLLPALLLSGLIFAGTLLLAERLYYTGWTSMQVSARKKRPARGVARPDASPGGLLRLLPAPARAVMVKDALLLRRDPRNLSNLVTPVILGAVMLLTMGRTSPEEVAGQPVMQQLSQYILLALAVMFSWMLMFNLASMAFSREGRSYWFVKAAPVRPAHLLAAKYLVAYLPSLAFGLLYLLLGFVYGQVPWSRFPFLAFVLVMAIAGSTGISLAFGTAAANLYWDSPQRQRLRGKAGCLMLPAVLGFLALALALYLVPPLLEMAFDLPSPLLGYPLGLLLGTSAALLAVWLPLRLVAPRIARIGEES